MNLQKSMQSSKDYDKIIRLEVLAKELKKELKDIKSKNKTLNNNKIKNESIISNIKAQNAKLKKDNDNIAKKIQ